MFSTRIMATSCCCYSFATCCCCCCYELERDLSLDHARRPPILSLASISSLVYTARLRAMQRKECTPRDENQKKKTTTPRAASSSSSFVVFPRAQTGTRAIFFWCCELELVNSKEKEEFFWHYWGGSVLFTFCFPYFFLSFVSLTSLSLFQHKTNDFLSKLACVTFAVVEGVFRSIGAF